MRQICAGHPLQDLPHLREDSVGRDQLATLDCAIGVRDRLVKLGQLLSRELDLVFVNAVEPTSTLAPTAHVFERLDGVPEP